MIRHRITFYFQKIYLQKDALCDIPIMNSIAKNKGNRMKVAVVIAITAMTLLSSMAIVDFTNQDGTGSSSHNAANAMPLAGALPTYKVTFTETGLPANYEWAVVFNSVTERSSGPSISFNATHGTFSYIVRNTFNFYPAPASGTVTVNGSNKNVQINFHSDTYLVTFDVRNYASITRGSQNQNTWSVSLDGMNNTTQSNTVNFYVKNGTHTFVITPPAGYSALPATGSISVDGSNVMQNLTFENNYFQVTFNEAGLPSSSGSKLVTEWHVTITGGKLSSPLVMYSNTSNISLLLPAGSYSYTVGNPSGYFSTPDNGIIVVAQSSVVTDIQFSTLFYNMVFKETGLPSTSLSGAYGAEWGVKIVNTTSGVSSTQYSSGNTISFYENNGTYRYYILNLTNYKPTAESGKVIITGNSYLIPVSFASRYYTLTFQEKRLPSFISSGRSVVAVWGVSVENSTSHSILKESTNQSALSFLLAPGSYSYTVASPAGYSASNQTSATPITLNANRLIGETFTNTETYTSSGAAASVMFTEFGLPSGSRWTVAINNTSGSSSFTSIYQNNLITSLHAGTYFYTVDTFGGYAPTVRSGIVTLTSSATLNINVTFLNTFHIITFKESGLPYEKDWAVALQDPAGTSVVHPTSTGSVTFNVPNGTYTYRIIDTGFFHPSVTQGKVTVNGTQLLPSSVINVNFVSDSTVLSFKETGIPAYVNWTVSIMTANGGVISNTSSYGTITFTVTNGTYRYFTYTVGSYSPHVLSGIVTATGNAVSVPLTFFQGGHTVTFNEKGLPAGSKWSIYLGGILKSSRTGSNITYTLSNGSYYFMVEPSGNYWNDLPSVIVYVQGSDSSYNVTFKERFYAVTVAETGLKAGTVWSFSLGGHRYTSNGSSVSILKENGTYLFNTVSTDSYYPVPSDGMVNVVGSAVSVAIKFNSGLYSVTFKDLNLTGDTSWGVLLSNSNVRFSNSTTPLVFELANGTYSYTVLTFDHYVASPPTGTITVLGNSVTVDVTFRLYQYAATFSISSGLPSGDVWYANVTAADGTVYSQSSTSLAMSFSLLNGTYSYRVSSSNKSVTPENPTGTFTVNGSGHAFSFVFKRVYYAVTIKESGLPSNTTWNVIVNGYNYTVKSDNVTVELTNGTYTYRLVNVDGYNSTDSTGNLTVKGSSSTTFITFTPVKHTFYVPPPTVSSTVPFNKIVLYILIAIGAIGLLVIFVVYSRGRRK